MTEELIEATRPVRAYYNAPGAQRGHYENGRYVPSTGAGVIDFQPGVVNRVPSDVLGALLAKPAIEGYFLDGTLSLLSPAQAVARVEGAQAFAAPEVPAAQVAAEAYAQARDGVQDPSQELKERTARKAALEAALTRGKLVEQPKPTKLKPRQHGVALDEEEAAPPAPPMR